MSSDLKLVHRRPLLDAVDWTAKKSGDASEEPETVGFVSDIFNNGVSRGRLVDWERHVHGDSLQMHRNEGHLHGFECHGITRMCSPTARRL